MSICVCQQSYSALRLAQCVLLLVALMPAGARAERLPVRAYTTADGLARRPAYAALDAGAKTPEREQL